MIHNLPLEHREARKRLMAFTASYGQISPIIPYVIAAPLFLQAIRGARAERAVHSAASKAR